MSLNTITMKIPLYLNQLLHEKEAVILPGFGEFRTVSAPAQKDDKGLLTPPAKTLTFNPGIKANDYMLARYIAVKENLSITQGNELLKQFVNDLITNLNKQQKVEIPNIGTLTGNTDQSIHFTSAEDINFDISSLGLTPINLKDSLVEKPNDTDSKIDKNEPSKKRKVPAWIFLILLLIILGVTAVYKQDVLKTYYQKTISLILPNKKQLPDDSLRTSPQPLETHPAEASLPITTVPDSIPDSTSITTTEMGKTVPPADISDNQTTGNWHIIAGCFSNEANALRQVAKLQEKGFSSAAIRGQTPSGLYRVSAGSFLTREEAQNSLNKDAAENKLINAWVAKL